MIIKKNAYFWKILERFNFLMKASIEGPDCTDPENCHGHGLYMQSIVLGRKDGGISIKIKPFLDEIFQAHQAQIAKGEITVPALDCGLFGHKNWADIEDLDLTFLKNMT